MSIIRIKRSETAGDPSTLGSGELAYSNYNGSGGGRLYIGVGVETNGNAASHAIIGGTYFTNLMNGTAGTLEITKSSIPILSATGTIDKWLVGNLQLTNNTISVTNTGNLTLTPGGSGKVSIAGAYTLPKVDGSNGYALTTDGNGTVSWQPSSGNLNISGSSGTGTIALLSQSLTINGNSNVTTLASNQSITISVNTATTSVLGVASFDSNSFSVTAGAVSIKTGGISNAQLSSSTITINGTSVSLGGSASISAIIENTLTISTGLIGTSFDGSQAVTISLDTATVMTTAVSASTATYAGYAFSFNTGTLVANAVNALTSDFATTSGYAQSFNTGTLVANAVSASTATNASYAFSFNTGTLVANAVSASVAGKLSNSLTIGTGLLGNSFDGSAGVTIKVDNTIATTSTTQTLINKTIDANNNTINNLTNGNLSGSAGITNANLQHSKITVGTTDISLGSSTTVLSGLTEVTIADIKIKNNEVGVTGTNSSLYLKPNGLGTVDVSNARITSVSDPDQIYDAANKKYVDATASGLHIHESVVVATTASLSANYYNGTTGTGATLTATVSVSLTSLDNYSLQVNDRILVKNQTTLQENGIYTITDLGENGVRPWSLLRVTDYDNHIAKQVAAGDFVFVSRGTQGGTGWVQTNAGTGVSNSIIIGTDEIKFSQFSGAGTYLAGNGLLLNGNVFSATGTNGIIVSNGSVQINETVAGDGLTFSSGIIAVGGTSDRITVSTNAIDIASTYVGQTSITTVGTIAVGTWTADTITTQYGGTGLTSYANWDLLYGNASGALGQLQLGSAGKILQVNTTGNALIYDDIDGGVY